MWIEVVMGDEKKEEVEAGCEYIPSCVSRRTYNSTDGMR
jgi:hypothetical protein